MKEILSKRVGTIISRADPISEEDEDQLLQNGISGTKNCFFFAVHFIFTVVNYLTLEGVIKIEFWTILSNSNGKYLRFIGRSSKTYKGSIGHLRLENQDIKHYSNACRQAFI